MIHTTLKRFHFKQLKARSKRFHYTSIAIEASHLSIKEPLLYGITAPKKYGSSVERNRFKRWVRFLLRENKEPILKWNALNFLPKKSISSISFQEIFNDWNTFLKEQRRT